MGVLRRKEKREKGAAKKMGWVASAQKGLFKKKGNYQLGTLKKRVLLRSD